MGLKIEDPPSTSSRETNRKSQKLFPLVKMQENIACTNIPSCEPSGWYGQAMVLGNFQCLGILLIWTIVEQGPTVLAMGTGGGSLDIFSPPYHIFFLSPSVCKVARYRLKYCLKELLNPKQSIM